MITTNGIAKAFALGLLAAVISGVALQQGGPLHTIKSSAPDSGINSVYYDSDEIWVVGLTG
jgi:hypothetical protein